jgi:cobyrinic acid a,c-diamide synthase
VAALVHGFTTYDPSVRLGGVVLNRVGSDRHEQILREALEDTGVPVLGALRRHDALVTPSRHLGLVPVAERSADAVATVRALGEVVAASLDLDAVLALARSAPDLPGPAWEPYDALAGAPSAHDHGGDAGGGRARVAEPVVAVAGGPAFTFSYAETAELLQAAGARVVTVDPLADERLPDGTAGLVIGGGFPEVYGQALSENAGLRSDVARLAASGAPVAAECAGLLYLARELDGLPMCGVLDAAARMTPRLVLGYREAVATVPSVLADAGTRVRGHEFHRTAVEPGRAPAWAWRGGADGFVQGGVHASYLHLHWAGQPQMAARLVAAASRTAVAA